MYTNTWTMQNAQNRMMSNFISDTLTYHDGIFFQEVLLLWTGSIYKKEDRCFYSKRSSIRDKRVWHSKIPHGPVEIKLETEIQHNVKWNSLYLYSNCFLSLWKVLSIVPVVSEYFENSSITFKTYSPVHCRWWTKKLYNNVQNTFQINDH